MERTGTAGVVRSIKGEAVSKEVYSSGIFCLAGLLNGAFLMSGSFNPVGMAYIAAFLGEGMQFYFTVLTVTGGFVLGGGTQLVPSYAIAVLLFTFYGIIADRRNKKITASVKALSALVIFALSGLIKGVIEADLLYMAIPYLPEGLVVFSLVYIFDRGISAIKTLAASGSVDRSDILGLCAMAAFSVTGAAALYTGAVPLHIILVFYIIMLVGFIFGAEMSAAAGTIMGFSLFFGGSIDTRMFVIMCVSSIMPGILRESGRIMAAAGCVSSAFMAAYCFEMLDISFVLGVCASCIMFLASAGRIVKRIIVTDVKSIKADEEHYAGMRTYITGRLTDCCKSIEALYKSFMPEKSNADKAKKRTEELADKVAHMVCEDCPLSRSCWNASFYNTYQTLLRLFALCEKKGRVSAEELPSVFRDYCVKQNEFAEAVNAAYSAHRERIIWEMRLGESRQIAREQLEAVAEMMKYLAEEFENRAGFKENIERILLYELKRTAGNVERVTVEEGEHGEYEVTVYKRGCEGRQACRDRTIGAVSGILGRTVRRAEKECAPDKDGRCKLVLRERCSFKVSAAAAMAIKDDERVSGDSYSFMELPKGGYMIALSDGMGSGRAAGEESGTVIELLERFAEAGFKREPALKLINSALVMGADNESFATLDMCCIDMYSGSAEFIKTGAAATFVIREGKAKAIRSSSLPIGMLKYFDMDRAECKLKRNDVILMLTDGAAEVIDRDGMSDTVLTELMKNNKMKDPKDIAEYVLESLKERSGFRIQDDMTVVAARVW